MKQNKLGLRREQLSTGFLKVITAVAFALENVDDDDDGCVNEMIIALGGFIFLMCTDIEFKYTLFLKTKWLLVVISNVFLFVVLGSYL
ncbi:hypothetical protein ARALYDRAFT_917336 [Arabidopsis lyrata subsp. lyrata]|uniref:Transmembrane protein n=1 Tax=Arabidopsis lyrata subsp. lyrata TaxID=81972 RepID=D7MP93_ARALL|nr:hypothetical protein ARALYDRAFT_917336 [Arabidopsis lyrata subsp. lyrata]